MILTGVTAPENLVIISVHLQSWVEHLSANKHPRPGIALFAPWHVDQLRGGCVFPDQYGQQASVF